MRLYAKRFVKIMILIFAFAYGFRQNLAQKKKIVHLYNQKSTSFSGTNFSYPLEGSRARDRERCVFRIQRGKWFRT